MDQLSFFMYGSILLLIAIGCTASLTDSDTLERLVLQLLRLLRLRPLLAAAGRMVHWLQRLTALQFLRMVAAAIHRCVPAGWGFGVRKWLLLLGVRTRHAVREV